MRLLEIDKEKRIKLEEIKVFYKLIKIFRLIIGLLLIKNFPSQMFMKILWICLSWLILKWLNLNICKILVFFINIILNFGISNI